MKLKRYAIRCRLEDGRYLWAKNIGDRTIIEPKFDLDCIMGEDQANQFIGKPFVDKRYEKVIVNIEIKRIPLLDDFVIKVENNENQS